MVDINKDTRGDVAADEKAGLIPRFSTLDIHPSSVDVIIESDLSRIANQKADPRFASFMRTKASTNLNKMSRWLFDSVS